MLRSVHAAALSALLFVACSPAGRAPEPGNQPPGPDQETGQEIGEEEAVETAREHVDFEVRSVDAEKTTEQGRPVWRITFRGRPPGEGNAMGEVVIVILDRTTGELVSLAQS